MPQLLWRIDGELTAPNLERWQQGLTLHLLFQSITLVMARRDGHTRHYLALAGCPVCRPDGCDRVCHRVLFEQLIRTSLPGLTLIPTLRLVPRATEARRLLVTPTRADAHPLDAAFLAQWEEARLVTTWSRLKARPQPIRVGALLAVGQQGPDPWEAVRSRGWSASRVKTLLYRTAFDQAVPAAVPISRRSGEALLHALRDPHLLTGAASAALAIPDPPTLPNPGDVGAPFSENGLVANSSGEA